MPTPPGQITEPKNPLSQQTTEPTSEPASPSAAETKAKNDQAVAKVLKIMDHLDDAVISRLESHDMCSSARPLAPATGASTEPCGICYDELKDPIRSTCGRHIFCRSCLLDWLKHSPTCPFCRHSPKDMMRQIETMVSEDLAEARNSMREVVYSFDFYLDFETGLLNVESVDKAFKIVLKGWVAWHEQVIRWGLKKIPDSDPARHWYADLMREEVDLYRETGLFSREMEEKYREPSTTSITE